MIKYLYFFAIIFLGALLLSSFLMILGESFIEEDKISCGGLLLDDCVNKYLIDYKVVSNGEVIK